MMSAIREALFRGAPLVVALGVAVTSSTGVAHAGAKSVQQIPACAQKSTEEAALKAARHAKKSKKELQKHQKRVAALSARCNAELAKQRQAVAREKERRSREASERKRVARERALKAEAENARRQQEARTAEERSRRARDAEAAEALARQLREAKAADARRARKRAPKSAPPPAPPPASPVAGNPVARQPTPILALLEQDRRALSTDHADVFGIHLGERLKLRRCKRSKSASDEGPSCIQRGEEAPAVARQMADLEDAELPRGVELSLVQLSQQDCPRWIGRQCRVSVATQTGFVMGVTFATERKSERLVATNLTKRYEAEPTSIVESTCDADATQASTHRVWRTPHLTTAFLPIAGATCEEGRVRIETRTMTQLLRSPSAPTASR